MVETLRNASVAGRVVYKEQLLDRAVLQGELRPASSVVHGACVG